MDLKRSQNYRKMLSRLGFYAFIIIVIGLFVYPIFWFIGASFKNAVDIFHVPPIYIFKPIFKHYKELFEIQNFHHNLLNSLIISTSSLALSLLIGVPAAYALSRTRWRGKNVLFFWILTSRMIPPMALAVPFFMFFSKLHLMDTHISLIVVYLSFNLALVIWIMRIFFDDIPVALEEAATIDGCSAFGCFWKISLPLVRPGLAATTILCWIMCWNEFLFALVLTRKVAKTAPVAVTIFLRFIDVHWGTIAAGSTFIMLPIILFAFLVHKYLISGLVKGALKE